MTHDKALLREAQDPHTSGPRLREIYREAYAANRVSDTAEAIAVHPNTQPNLLEVLVKTYPQAVLRNPALPLVLLEDPGWAQRLPSDTALSLLRFENVPTALLHAFAGQPRLVGSSARLHVGLAGEASAGWEAEAREALWETDVREALWDVIGQTRWSDSFPVRLLTLDLVPDWLLEPLAGHSDSRVRQAVARSIRTPPGVLTPLRRAGSTSDLGGLAPPDLSLPAPILERLTRGGPWAKRLAARHPNTPPDVLEQLAAGLKANIWGDDKMVWRCLVRNPNTPADLRTSLAVEFDAEFRRASARDPETPSLALAALSLSEVRDVRWMAARNPNTPVEALGVLAADPDARVRQGVGRNVAVPPPLLALLAADSVRWVRLAAARHAQTPPSVLEWLAEDPDEEVRQSVARRARPVSPRPKPLKQPRQTPPTSRPSRPDIDPAERAQVLDKAAGNSGLLIKTAVLACADTSPKYLAGGATDSFWPCRLAVARNPAAFLLLLAMPGTEADLQTLARDGNRFVRAAARAALAAAAEKVLP